MDLNDVEVAAERARERLGLVLVPGLAVGEYESPFHDRTSLTMSSFSTEGSA